MAQVILTLILNFVYLGMLIHLRPYKSRSEQLREVINEYIAVINIYFLFAFTTEDFLEASQRDTIGVSLIGVTALNFFLNLLAILCQIKTPIKRRYIMCQRKRALKKKLRSRTTAERTYDIDLQFRAETAIDNQKAIKKLAKAFKKGLISDEEVAR